MHAVNMDVCSRFVLILTEHMKRISKLYANLGKDLKCNLVAYIIMVKR